MKFLICRGFDGRTIPFIICLISSRILYPQANINLQFNSFYNNFNLTDLWNLQLINVSGQTLQAYLVAEIEAEDQPGINQILTAKTNVFNILKGTFTTSAQSLNASYDYHDSTLGSSLSSGSFPSGGYSICYILKAAADDIEISRNCVFIKVSSGSGHVSKSLKSKVVFTGYIEAEGFYNYSQPAIQNTASDYVRLSVNPSLSLFNMPFGSTLLLSIGGGSGLRSINRGSFFFDSRKFIENLKQRAVNRIKDDERIKNTGILNTNSKIQEWGSIDNILKNPKVIEELNRLNELKNIEKTLSDTAFTNIQKLSNKNEIIRRLAGYINTDSLRGIITDTASYFLAYQDSLKARMLKYEYLKKKEKAYNAILLKKQKLDSLLTAKGLDSLTMKKENIINKLSTVKEFDYSGLANSFVLKNKLTELGLLKKYEKYLFSLHDLTLGTFNPYYSDLTLSGMPVKGFNICVEPGKFNVCFTKGILTDALITDSDLSFSYRRNLTSASFGYGYKNNSYIRIHILSFEDKAESVPDSLFMKKKNLPLSNKVMSLQYKLQLYKNRISIEGELAGSQTTDNNILKGENEIFVDSLPYTHSGESSHWFTNILLQKKVNMGTSIDYALKVGITACIFRNKTIISFTSGRVGPQYFSAGIPFLRNDRLSFEAKINQHLFNNNVSFSLFGRYDHDNLNHFKTYTTTNLNTGGDINIRYKKLPSLNLSGMYILFKNNMVNNTIIIINLLLVHGYKTGKLMNNTNLSAMLQYNSSSFLNNVIIGNMMLNHSTFLTKDIALRAGFSCNLIHASDSIISLYTVNASVSVCLLKVVHNTLGVKVMKTGDEFKYGLTYEMLAILNKYISLRLDAGSSLLENYLYNDVLQNMQEYMVKASLLVRW